MKQTAKQFAAQMRKDHLVPTDLPKTIPPQLKRTVRPTLSKPIIAPATCVTATCVTVKPSALVRATTPIFTQRPTTPPLTTPLPLPSPLADEEEESYAPPNAPELVGVSTHTITGRIKNPFRPNDLTRLEDGGLLYDPYNANNMEIADEDLSTLLNQYGQIPYSGRLDLYREAFVHESYSAIPPTQMELTKGLTMSPKPESCMELCPRSNQRLEYLGDGVLELITKERLYRQYENATEEFMTSKKIELVKNEHIGKLVMQMGLSKWFLVSKNAEERGIRQNVKQLGCLFEALVGAIYVDSGYSLTEVRRFINAVYDQYVNWNRLLSVDDNYKNKLQVLIQKAFKVTPNYIELPMPFVAAETDQSRTYNMGVYLCLGQPIHSVSVNPHCAIPLTRFQSYDEMRNLLASNGQLFVCLGKGVHPTKTKAEQYAAKQGVSKLSTF